MSRCRKCQVYIRDNTEVCPLCRCVVEKSDDAFDAYPDISKKNRLFLLFTRIYLFLAIIAESIMVYFNHMNFDGTWWCVIPAGVMLYIYVTLRYAFGNSYSGYMIKIFVAALFAIGVLTLIDYGMGAYGWAQDYAVPGLLMLLDLVILILMMVNHRRWYSYISSQLIVFAVSLLQLIALSFGYIKNPNIVFLAIAVAGFEFLGTLIIGGEMSVNELRRRFHI